MTADEAKLVAESAIRRFRVELGRRGHAISSSGLMPDANGLPVRVALVESLDNAMAAAVAEVAAGIEVLLGSRPLAEMKVDDPVEVAMEAAIAAASPATDWVAIPHKEWRALLTAVMAGKAEALAADLTERS